MNETPDQLWEWAALAERVATQAGTFIASRQPHSIEHKDGGDSPASQVVTEVDRGSETIVIEGLAAGPGGLGLLTEEREDDGSRHRTPAFWCVDPLDGTLAYVRGEAGPAVSIALVRRDGTPLLGVVYDVTEACLVTAVRGGGVRRAGQAWRAPAAQGERLHIFGDRSFDAVAAYAEIAKALSPAQVQVGRAAVTNALAALSHPPGVYFKLPKPGRGGGSLWDFAATACIVEEAGGVVSTFGGDELPLNRPDTTFLGDCGVMVASDTSVADRVRAAREKTVQ